MPEQNKRQWYGAQIKDVDGNVVRTFIQRMPEGEWEREQMEADSVIAEIRPYDTQNPDNKKLLDEIVTAVNAHEELVRALKTIANCDLAIPSTYEDFARMVAKDALKQVGASDG